MLGTQVLSIQTEQSILDQELRISGLRSNLDHLPTVIPGTINFYPWNSVLDFSSWVRMGCSPSPERPLEFTQATGLARQLAFPFPFHSY